MGELGGVRDTKAEFKDNSLITYLYKKEDEKKVIDITAVRTIEPTSKKLFIQKWSPKQTEI